MVGFLFRRPIQTVQLPVESWYSWIMMVKDTKKTTYRVEYTAYGNSLTMTFQGLSEVEGTPAKARALDYYDAALSSPAGANARCVILRDGKPWLDTSWA